MRAPRLILCAVVLTLGAPGVLAEVWTSHNTQAVEGQLSGVYGSIAAITSAKGTTRLLEIEQMDDAGLARVADYLARAGKEPETWAASTGKVAASLRRRLEVFRDGRMVPFDPGTRPEPEIYLVYFGAHWCHPCREFSPHLVEAYRQLKEVAGDRFELVFVSSDRSRDDQVLYAREVGMPWPILRYSEVGSVRPLEQWEGPAIPDLIVVTRSGALLYDSFHGETYVGPQSVLDDVGALLDAMNESSASSRHALHQLRVLQFVRSAAAGSQGPKPYMIGLDPSHYQTLETKKLTATLNVDERGCVTDVKIEPQLPTALEFQLEQDVGTWLFLPLVANGHPKPTLVKVPIIF